MLLIPPVFYFIPYTLNWVPHKYAAWSLPAKSICISNWQKWRHCSWFVFFFLLKKTAVCIWSSLIQADFGQSSFPQYCALQLPPLQLDAMQSRDQRIYLYCTLFFFFFLYGQNARSETLVHLLHSFGSSLLGFLEDKLLHGKKPRVFIFPGWIQTCLPSHPLCLQDIRTNIRFVHKNLFIVWN